MTPEQARKIGEDTARKNANVNGYPRDIKTSAEREAFDRGVRNTREQQKQTNR